MGRSIKRAETILKELAHRDRLRIMKLLDTVDSFQVHELVERLNKAQTTVSKHLRIMRNVNVIDYHAEGKNRRYYLIDSAVVEKIMELLPLLERHETENLDE